MRVLVTGSHGFIGTNLVERLKLQGHEVFEFDIKIGRSMFNVWKFPKPLDIIYHLACVNQEEALKNSDKNLQVNAEGAQLMAEMAKRTGARLIYTSTASVYGNAEEFPTPNSAKCQPLSTYGVAKLAGEHFITISGADYLIYRLSNVYGPHQTTDNPYCGVVAKFIEATERGEKLKIYGNGKQTRDFTYVDDVIDELIDPQYVTGIKNLSHGQETSINELAEEVSKACGKLYTSWESKPRPVDGIHRRVLRSNVNCPTSLQQGLEKTVEWYRNASAGKGSSVSAASSRSAAISR